MNELRRRHQGETGYIVGRGPSLLNVTAADFGPGPVITLNLAIRNVRALGLPNPIYTMQKDGCMQQDPAHRQEAGRCPGPCGEVEPMVQPVEPEMLLVAATESRYCFPDYPHRRVFDVEADFGLAWFTPSAPVAVMIARLFGCPALVMIAHDAYTRGDTRTVKSAGLIERHDPGYLPAGRIANDLALSAGLTVTWR